MNEIFTFCSSGHKKLCDTQLHFRPVHSNVKHYKSRAMTMTGKCPECLSSGRNPVWGLHSDFHLFGVSFYHDFLLILFFFTFFTASPLHPLWPCTLHFPLDLFPILPSQPANIFLSLFSPSHLYILSSLPTYFAVYLRLYTMSSCCPPFCPSSLSYSALSLKHCRGNLIWVYLVFRRIPFSCQLSLPPDTKTNRACPAKSSKHCWCWLHYLVFTFQMNPTALHFLFVPFLWA